MYRCLVCDIPLLPDMFQTHALWHGWQLPDVRQCGFEFEKEKRIATHEFGIDTSLYWFIRHLNPLPEEIDL
jgi:hypothetical protein